MLRRLVKRPQSQLWHVFDTEFHLKVTTTNFCGGGVAARMQAVALALHICPKKTYRVSVR